MKIRTDFVTNSSSSSFIFKEFNKEAVKKAVERKLSVLPEDKWEEKYYEWAREMVPYIVGKRFCEHTLRDLMEVYSWYRDDVMECLFEAQYLYFDEMETNYLICEALKEAGVCLYSCGHMG